jgi:hypothetical protein
MPHPILYGRGLRGYAPYARGLRSGPIEWIIWWITRKRKSTNVSFIYYSLYMLIMQVYHDSSRMPDSGWKIWLRSYILTLVALPNSGWCHDSGRASQFRSMSMPHALPPQLWKTSHDQTRWLQYLTTQTLSRNQTRRDAWVIQCSKQQHLTASHVQVSDHVPRDHRTLSPAWSERNPSI